MRLIDADELINQGYEIVVDGLQYDTCNKSIDIDDIPTAYSVDKVVEELECNRCESCSLLEVCAGSKYCGKCHEKIIEIVKQGSVSDDVCEWKSASDGEFIQNPHTKRLYSNEPSMQNVYCNTCGKKIKVVN